MSLHMKHRQLISPIFLNLFLNSNNESLESTAAGRLMHTENHGNELHCIRTKVKIKSFW